MKEFNSRELQLSDLTTVLALLKDGTVTRAAQSLGVSQSALSYQLDRMRTRFEDPLFVRVGNRMSPTPFAERLADPAARVMRIVETEIAGLGAFDPSTTEREFRIGLNELGAITLLPKLVRRMAELAPRARLTSITVDAATIPSALDSGAMDIAAGHFPQTHDLLLQQLLYERDYVCIVRRDHPRIGTSMTMREFCDTPSIETPASPVTLAWLEEELSRRGLQSTVQMSVRQFSAIPFVVAACDCLAVIPRGMFDAFAPIAAIKVVKLPIRIPPVQIHQYWHPRMASDPAIKFFRELVFATARSGVSKPSGKLV
ncbi:MAG: LysR family transcriptional regulator [Pseudomonadota bacterium]